MTIFFRVDASCLIGSGHVVRCLTLADGLSAQGFECVFVCRSHEGNMIGLIQAKGYGVRVLPSIGGVKGSTGSIYAQWLGVDQDTDAQQTLDLVCVDSVQALIVDHYGLDHVWQSHFRKLTELIVVIDDLANRTHDCDVLLDQNWYGARTLTRYDDLLLTPCVKLLGPDFALLKPEYALLRGLLPSRDGLIRRVLVFMGGVDSHNQTLKVLEALDEGCFLHWIVDVVIGQAHPNSQSIRERVKNRANTSLYESQPSLAGFMARADVMVGAGGTTSWERLCVGLPCVVLSVAENQLELSRALDSEGFVVHLGAFEQVSGSDIQDALLKMANDPKRLKILSAQMRQMVDGLGVNRVSERITQEIRSRAIELA